METLDLRWSKVEMWEHVTMHELDVRLACLIRIKHCLIPAQVISAKAPKATDENWIASVIVG
jgi:hypothetical protein